MFLESFCYAYHYYTDRNHLYFIEKTCFVQKKFTKHHYLIFATGRNKKMKKYVSYLLCGAIGILCGCGSQETALVVEENTQLTAEPTEPSQTKENMENTQDGEHVIEVDGESASYTNLEIVKSGDSEGDEADFYGENAAIFATNGGVLTLENSQITTNGTHANAVFSYGEGTIVNVVDTTIETSGNCSGGIMTTGGGTMNATNLNVHTTGNSSAAIRSDRGGGTVNVAGGTYTAEGKGSPAIYSTADITVNDATLTSTSAQGIVVEGKNSVTLNGVTLDADNTSKNSDKSDTYQAVMIYQSMSGDAAEGEASFTMNGGSLTNHNGDIFFVNNTVASITLENAQITNEAEGVFLRAEAAGWGQEGSNGGHVNLYAKDQSIEGDMIVDTVSTLNLYLTGNTHLSGAINPSNEWEVYVEVSGDAKWTLTGDSYITSLTCEENNIDLNGYTLYVNGVAYEKGSASSGEAIEVAITSGNTPPSMPEGGTPPAKPEGGTPPDKPDGESPKRP